MRRIRIILALLTGATAVALSGAYAPRADAHFCSVPAEIKVGVDVMVNIGVAAEAKPVRAVDIQIPDGFVLKDPVGYLGYTATIRGKWAHFEGAEIAPYTCHYFGFGGQATKKGRLVSEIITTADDGTKTHYTDLRPISQFPAMVIFAGVNAADFTQPTPTAKGGTNIWVALGVAIGAGLLVVGAAVAINRRQV